MAALCTLSPLGLPHASGGVSEAVGHANAPKASSPREWGCFQLLHVRLPLAQVFPTRVGVFLPASARSHCCWGLPHASGGVSRRWPRVLCGPWSSPREWGCFCVAAAIAAIRAVFPTRVGVFLSGASSRPTALGLPHASGGVSSKPSASTTPVRSSPREWGCFQNVSCFAETSHVFPTRVGVFLMAYSRHCICISLPHASGGVSCPIGHGSRAILSSPREWGCFQARLLLRRSIAVFPTRVGVFLPALNAESMPSSLPHASGGVSEVFCVMFLDTRSSPREWGCFSAILTGNLVAIVFPTRVGVFPTEKRPIASTPGLPHASGGVSAARG